MNGFIKLYRSMMDWEWYQNANVMRVFLHLLLDANHKTKRWQGKEILPGQTVTSYQGISKKTGISVQSVRTSIHKLKSTGELTSKSTNRFTLITIVNWSLYQSQEETLTNKPTSKLTNNQQTTNKQLTTNKNDKKDKKNIYGEFQNVLLTDDEYQKLVDRLPGYQSRIDSLSEYIESHGKKYKSHYATILSWARKDGVTLQSEKTNEPPQPQFESEEQRQKQMDYVAGLVKGTFKDWSEL